MGESRIRRLLGGGLILLLLCTSGTLGGCTSGSGGQKSKDTAGQPAPRTGSDSAAYVPFSSEGEELPAWATNPGSGGGSAARAPDGGPAPTDPRTASRTRPAWQPEREVAPPRQEAPPIPSGPQYRVTWEALAVERERFANPRFGRRNQAGVLNTQKVVLVNESHPDARAAKAGRCVQNSQGVAVGAIADRDMETFLRGIEQRGFFRLARPTGSMQALFEDSNTRGRITIERGGQSVSLVSMRGQGLNPQTKAIPAMYSEVKQAVMLLRNQTGGMSVVGVSRDPMRR